MWCMWGEVTIGTKVHLGSKQKQNENDNILKNHYAPTTKNKRPAIVSFPKHFFAHLGYKQKSR